MNNGVVKEVLTEPKPLSLGLPRIFMLQKSNPVAWMLMPEFLNRVKQFCLTEDTDSNGEALADAIMRDFVVENHVFGLMVAVHEGKVCGHLLASVDRWYDKLFCTVLQYQWDQKLGVSRGLIQAGFDTLADWANLNMCQAIQALVPNQTHKRRLEMLYGFHEHKLLMRKEI